MLPVDSGAQRLSRVRQLHKLVHWFVGRAHHDVATIVQEESLPVARKTIKPIDAGGVAGGQKFLSKDGIFFKRCALARVVVLCSGVHSPVCCGVLLLLVLTGCCLMRRWAVSWTPSQRVEYTEATRVP